LENPPPKSPRAAVGARGDETDSFLKFAVFKRFACLWDFAPHHGKKILKPAPATLCEYVRLQPIVRECVGGYFFNAAAVGNF